MRSNQGVQDMAFPRVQFSKMFSGGACQRTPLYNSCIRGGQSACFSSNSGALCPWVTKVLYNWSKRYRVIRYRYEMIPNLDENRILNLKVWTPKKETIQNETKLPLWKSLSQSGDQNSSWIMNLEEHSPRSHKSLRQKRQESWISRFKWFRFYPWERSN